MESNSIRDNLSKEDMISDIVLSLGADINKKQVFLVVEGEDDIKFLRAFLADNVFVYESYNGKHGVEYIVEDYFKNDERVIGIRDRDYQVEYTFEKLFYYDYNCMEMMLINNDNVLKNIYVEFYRGQLTSEKLRSKVLKELKIMSVMRMLNEQNGWGKKFKGISLNIAWNQDKQKLERNRIISKFNKINAEFIDENILHIIEQELKNEWNEEEFYEYTQGHDFSTLLATICNQYINKEIKNTDIESHCRCIFREDDFVKTKLYNTIKE